MRLVPAENLSPSFRTTILELEVLVLVYVHSLRLSSFIMYPDALTELAPWIHDQY